MELITSSTKNISYSLYPVYHSSEKLNNVGLNSKGLSKLIIFLLKELKKAIPENLSQDIIFKHNFIDRYQAFQNIHFPANPKLLNAASSRLKYEELFFLQIALLKQKIIKKK